MALVSLILDSYIFLSTNKDNENAGRSIIKDKGELMKRSGRASAIALEAVGCCVVLSGIIIEVIYEANIGFVLMTIGGWGVAVGSLIFAKLLKRD
jgi:hypothetical protein